MPEAFDQICQSNAHLGLLNNYLLSALSITDQPTAGQQLTRHIADILNTDVIGPKPPSLRHIGLLGQEVHGNAHDDSARFLGIREERFHNPITFRARSRLAGSCLPRAQSASPMRSGAAAEEASFDEKAVSALNCCYSKMLHGGQHRGSNFVAKVCAEV